MTTDSPPRQRGLHDLASVELLPEQEAALERLRQVSLGSPIWRARKEAEVRELFALERIADRMQIRMIDPTTELFAVVALETPVACRAPGAEDIVVESQAELALLYPEAILRGPLPGHALVNILKPQHVYHANVGSLPSAQPLCLGANVPRGFPLREAILAAYGALSMQTLAIDEQDPAGVMRGDAARWWQANRERLPLSTEPFLAPRAPVSSSQEVSP